MFQAGLELLTSSDPPASASQSVGITGIAIAPGPQKIIIDMGVCPVELE